MKYEDTANKCKYKLSYHCLLYLKIIVISWYYVKLCILFYSILQKVDERKNPEYVAFNLHYNLSVDTSVNYEQTLFMQRFIYGKSLPN